MEKRTSKWVHSEDMRKLICKTAQEYEAFVFDQQEGEEIIAGYRLDD
jgi:hypothetical protein